MEDEITEVTLIEGQKRHSPSFWANWVTLALLVAIVLGAQKWVERWSDQSLPAEAMDKEIVLEDLETEEPLVESESVPVPSVKEKQRTEDRKLKAESVYTKPDPYTSGGTQDLDRPENWPIFFPGRPKEGVIKEKVPAKKSSKEATATPLLPNERDQFIPFESD